MNRVLVPVVIRPKLLWVLVRAAIGMPPPRPFVMHVWMRKEKR